VPRFELLGGATAFPARVLQNDEALAHLRPTLSAERRHFLADGLREETGLDRRAWSHLPGRPFLHDVEESSAGLGAEAARGALAEAGADPADVDVLICVTSTPTHMTTALSAEIGGILGLEAAAFDLRAGCSAGLPALTTAALQLRGGARRVLLVCADTFSKVVPGDATLMALGLGDGAAAVLLGEGTGLLCGGHFRSDGRRRDFVTTPGRLPPTVEDVEAGLFALAGQPDSLNDALPALYEEALRGALAVAGLDASAISAYIPHQTSRGLIEAVAQRLGFQRTWQAVGRHANVGSAGWLVALLEARSEGFVGAGDTVALAAAGGGLSWGAVVVRL